MYDYYVPGMSPMVGVFSGNNYVECHTASDFNERDFVFEQGKTYPIIEETETTISIGGSRGGYLVFAKDGASDLLYLNWFKKADIDDRDTPFSHHCIQCCAPFVTPVDERLWYFSKGWSLPKRCKACRDLNKAKRCVENN